MSQSDALNPDERSNKSPEPPAKSLPTSEPPASSSSSDAPLPEQPPTTPPPASGVSSEPPDTKDVPPSQEISVGKVKAPVVLRATIDMENFQQILDLDEDDTHDFSQGMVWAYFSQAKQTFDDMDEALESKDLKKLSDLGHFLKGSSAALGVSRVQTTCEKIQHTGELRDNAGSVTLSQDLALAEIARLLAESKAEYVAAEAWLRRWYKNAGIEGDPE